jgi:hypothetical protein
MASSLATAFFGGREINVKISASTIVLKLQATFIEPFKSKGYLCISGNERVFYLADEITRESLKPA